MNREYMSPQDAMNYALDRARAYARIGDLTMARAMTACADLARRNLAMASTRPVAINLLDSTDLVTCDAH